MPTTRRACAIARIPGELLAAATAGRMPVVSAEPPEDAPVNEVPPEGVERTRPFSLLAEAEVQTEARAAESAARFPVQCVAEFAPIISSPCPQDSSGGSRGEASARPASARCR